MDRPCGLRPFSRLASLLLSRGARSTPSSRLTKRENVSQFFITGFFNSLLALEAILEEALSLDENGIESFLRTDYEPLVKWLDERFEVELTAMTPSQIFDAVPLNDVNYELRIDPARATKANFQASSISRRELLKSISDHWGLHLEIKYDDGGLPTAVQVTSR